jgi:hypothetical protein
MKMTYAIKINHTADIIADLDLDDVEISKPLAREYTHIGDAIAAVMKITSDWIEFSTQMNFDMREDDEDLVESYSMRLQMNEDKSAFVEIDGQRAFDILCVDTSFVDLVAK